MNLNDFSSRTSKTLNESVAKAFGCRLNLDKYSEIQLETAKNSLQTKLRVFETSSNYGEVFENAEYQRNRALLNVIEAAINERKLSPAEQKKREMYVKSLKDKKGEFEKRYGAGKGEEVMYATATKMAKAKDVKEAVALLRDTLTETVLTEGEEEKAAIIMTAKDMVDKLTGWLESVASLRAEAMLELLDNIRYELGSDISQKFANKAKPSLDDVYTCLERNRQALAQAVSILTGEAAPTTGAEGAPEPAPGQEPTPDLGATPAGGEPAEDNFAALAPATGGEEAAGRPQRESVELGEKLAMMLLGSKKN